jgi:hypothetical protein
VSFTPGFASYTPPHCCTFEPGSLFRQPPKSHDMRKRFRNESVRIDGKLPSLLRFTDEAPTEQSPSSSYPSAQNLGPLGEWQRLEVLSRRRSKGVWLGIRLNAVCRWRKMAQRLIGMVRLFP